jgi:hypothetical protein
MSIDSGTRSPELTSEAKQQLVTKLGSLLHDEWRAPRKQADGSFEPRIKKTKDEAWKAAQGKEEVDIANTSFADLPADWQGENRAAAEVAMNQVFQAAESGKMLDKAFIEDASAAVHDKWLERNGSWAPAEQKKPFGELSEEEREKDRAQIRKAIEIFEAA